MERRQGQYEGSEERELVNALMFTEEAAEEIARRSDWTNLEKVVTLTGTGAATKYSLPIDFARLTQGNAVKSDTGPIRGGLSADEWLNLPVQSGVPRFFRIRAKSIEFWPYLIFNAPITVTYQSLNWNGTVKRWLSDTDEALIPEVLIAKGAIWRWKRHYKQEFSDYTAEFEAAFKDFASFDDRMRSP
jgi:hypothetical protein